MQLMVNFFGSAFLAFMHKTKNFECWLEVTSCLETATLLPFLIKMAFPSRISTLGSVWLILRDSQGGIFALIC